MITVENLIRAGAMAQKVFDLSDSFGLRVFPPGSGPIVRVSVAKSVEDYRSPYGAPPESDEVEIRPFASTYNDEFIFMGYSKRLNILCLSIP